MKKNAALFVALILIVVGCIKLSYMGFHDRFMGIGFLAVGGAFIPIWLGQRK